MSVILEDFGTLDLSRVLDIIGFHRIVDPHLGQLISVAVGLFSEGRG